MLDTGLERRIIINAKTDNLITAGAFYAYGSNYRQSQVSVFANRRTAGLAVLH